MRKIACMTFLLFAQAISAYEGETYEKHKEILSREATIQVYTSQQLSDALVNAASNIDHGTRIIVHGTLIGNFEVPQTVHRIILEGANSGATLDANGNGTTLLIDYGAHVQIKKLQIIGATTTTGKGQANYGYGLFNQGIAQISDCSIDDNAPGGIWNWGELHIDRSFIENNDNTGIYNDFGNMNIHKCTIANNTGYGISSQVGELVVEECDITNNGTYGIYNYYGSECKIKNSTISDQAGLGEDLGHGVYNDWGTKNKIKNSQISGNSGYGIYNEGSVTTVDNCDIYENGKTGVYNYDYAVITIHKSDIHDNTDGGIYNDYADTYLSHCTINDNSSATLGGGIHNTDEGIVDVCHCTLQGNSSQANGGGIYNEFQITLRNSKIKENSALDAGGGIYNSHSLYGGVESSSVIIRDCQINENSASLDGGGVYNIGNAFVVFSDIKENTAAHGGGLANETTGIMTLVSSTVSHNIATSGSGSGGGIYNTGTSLTLEDTQVVNNIPDQIAP